MSAIRFDTFVGNKRNLVFRLRKRGFATFFNLSPATEVRLEVERLTITGITLLSPIICLPNAPGADFTNGRVVAIITGADVTALPASHLFSLTADIDLETITMATGRIEVRARPGFAAA